MIVEIEHKDRGKVKVPGFAPRMSENHIEYKASPGLGEHNFEVYQGILGLSDEEMKGLKDNKVI
jgi:crotonobetainyl-CoA:carnitine CoA-transferase CaiB-like acyl-CoA transferase